MPDPVPLSLNKTDNRELHIVWSDGREQVLGYRVLRDGCQCANCGEKRKADLLDRANADPTSLPVLSDNQLQPLDIVKMEPAGNYAYSIEFSDGHTSGLFTFDLIRSLTSE